MQYRIFAGRFFELLVWPTFCFLPSPRSWQNRFMFVSQTLEKLGQNSWDSWVDLERLSSLKSIDPASLMEN